MRIDCVPLFQAATPWTGIFENIIFITMNNSYIGKYSAAESLYDSYFLSIRMMYLCLFNTAPDKLNICDVDGEKAHLAFREKYSNLVTDTKTYNWYDRHKKTVQFVRVIYVLNTRSIVEFGPGYCELLHDGKQKDFVDELLAFTGSYKEKARRRPLEINLIVKGNDGLELRRMEVKRNKLDLDLFYENEFKHVDSVIISRLKKEKDKGIVLLHGLPGTGKTTYLRYLIGKIKKKVLFLSPDVAGNLMDPDFIQLLINNPNSVLIIEDAENIIMDRKMNNSSSVSNLLNISDGLLADFLNVQLVCTFNSALTLIDSALMRKGRLIAKYEFGKLGIDKAQRLSNHLGFNTIVNAPMTVAEIANQHEQPFETRQANVIGFRQAAVLQN